MVVSIVAATIGSIARPVNSVVIVDPTVVSYCWNIVAQTTVKRMSNIDKRSSGKERYREAVQGE